MALDPRDFGDEPFPYRDQDSFLSGLKLSARGIGLAVMWSLIATLIVLVYLHLFGPWLAKILRDMSR